MFRSLAKYHTQDCLAVQIFTHLKFLKLKVQKSKFGQTHIPLHSWCQLYGIIWYFTEKLW